MKKIGIFLAGMAIVALSWWGYCHGSGFGSGGSSSSSTVDNATIDSRIDHDHASSAETITGTLTTKSVTPKAITDALAAYMHNILTTGNVTGSTFSTTDGNFTVDSSGNVLMRTSSYIRDAENPFCQQYYSGTNYDDNYTEICAPETGYSETYRLYWPTAAPTGNQVLVFPAPTLRKSQGTWENLLGGGDLVSTNNLADVDNATTARRNLGLEIGVDVQAYDADLDTWAGVTPGSDVGTALAVAAGYAGSFARIVALGAVTHDHGSLGSGNCSSAIDGGTATGTSTTDRITWNFNGDPTGITGFAPSASGGLFIYAYTESDHVYFKLCNNTAGAIDPGEITLNWMVLR